MQLYCFSYAGGHAGIFLPWQRALEPHIQVCGIQLPGRASRMREPPMTSMESIVPQVALAIAADQAASFAFFGHSLGALLAFEVARYCARQGWIMPMHLFVSGCGAPKHRTRLEKLHLLPDEDLIREVRRFNGTPPEVLSNQELMQLVLPMLRADFALVDEYRYRPQPLLDVPMTVLAGKRDVLVSGGALARWAEETLAPIRTQWFEGDHFFINTDRDVVLSCIRDELLKPAVARDLEALSESRAD
jgi:surfactin synthase thioesterase subunit